jgi:hypothetical protein
LPIMGHLFLWVRCKEASRFPVRLRKRLSTVRVRHLTALLF